MEAVHPRNILVSFSWGQTLRTVGAWFCYWGLEWKQFSTEIFWLWLLRFRRQRWLEWKQFSTEIFWLWLFPWYTWGQTLNTVALNVFLGPMESRITQRRFCRRGQDQNPPPPEKYFGCGCSFFLGTDAGNCGPWFRTWFALFCLTLRHSNFLELMPWMLQLEMCSL